MSAWPAVGSASVGQITNLNPLRVRHVFVGLGPVAGVEPDEGGDTSLAVGRVPARLRVRGPAHPLVVEDGVGSHFIRYNHRLECVGLKYRLTFRKGKYNFISGPLKTTVQHALSRKCTENRKCLSSIHTKQKSTFVLQCSSCKELLTHLLERGRYRSKVDIDILIYPYIGLKY